MRPRAGATEVLNWVLDRMPAGYAPIVVDNGSTDGSGALAERLGARVVREPRRGFGAACWAGLTAATAEVVCFMDCDGSFDPRELPRVAGPVAAGRCDLVLGARAPRPGAWPAHARAANSLLASELRRRAGVPLRDLGPMRAARREALLRLGIEDRRFGWSLEMVLRGGGRLADRRGHRRLQPAPRPLEGDRHGPRHDPRGARHGDGAGMSRPALVVIAKAPVPGRVKTRLCPPCTPAQAAALAHAALADTLAACEAASAGRRVVALDGASDGWLPDGWDVVAQRGRGLAERLANAFADVGGPALVIGMDTPQVSAAQIAAALRALERADAVFGPATDGGYWAIGLREPDPTVFAGVPMSRGHTGAFQRSRLEALGLRTVDLPPLLDVDDIADARAVAARTPASRFAAELAAIDAGARARRRISGLRHGPRAAGHARHAVLSALLLVAAGALYLVRSRSGSSS